jgi:hypothetical protein
MRSAVADADHTPLHEEARETNNTQREWRFSKAFSDFSC